MADLFDKEELGVVGSLFGASPEGIQLAREQMAAKSGQQAGLNLLGGILGQTGVFAERGGQALRGVLGQQSPEEQVAALRQQAAQQFDPNTPQGLAQIAQFLNQNGDSAGARQAVMLAQGQMQKTATLNKTMAEEQAKLREPLPNIAKLQAYRTNLVAKLGPNDPQVKEVDAAIRAAGEGTAPRISIDQRGQTAFATGLGAEDAKRVNNAEKLIESAAGTLGTLKAMAEKDSLGVVSGTGANARIEALKFLDTAGFTTPAEKGKLANSENFNKLTGDLVLEKIKMLGTNPSNADRQFITDIVPKLESSSAARKQLITYMADKANAVVKEASTLSAYGRKNQGLSGYQPTIPLVNVTTPSRDISSYSLEELQAMQQNAKPAGAK